MATELPRIISKRELRQIIPLSPQHILRLEKLNRFPKRIRIGARRVGWRLSDVIAWIAEREAQSRGAAPAATKISSAVD